MDFQISFKIRGTKIDSFFPEEESCLSIRLINDNNQFDIYKFLPKNFIITTENQSCSFNSDILKNTSSKISEHLHNDPNLSYHLDINDERKVLSKFEKMYQGEVVFFNEEDLPACNKIVQMLNIQKCPEYMKSLLRNPQNKSIADVCCLGVQIDSKSFSDYLSNETQRTFKIITKTNSYKCTSYGALSSLIIRQLLLKDPNLDQFIYDFDDEFNEFQSICKLFNFEEVKLTSNNLKSIQKISKDLKIESILGIIDDYIKEMENKENIINEQSSTIQSINDLFDLLYKIKEYSIKYVKNKIIESFWIETKENIQELAAFILQVIKIDFSLHPSILELLIELDKESNESNHLNILLPFICKKLFESFGNKLSECSFIYKLYQKGIISKSYLMNELRIMFQIKHKHNNCTYILISHIKDLMNNIYVWFLPEIIELNQFYELFQFLDDVRKKFIQKFWPDKIDDYKKLRDLNEPDDELIKSLRYDDVDSLQSFLSINEVVNLNETIVPFNLFEDFVPNGFTSYLNYAAAYGSIKCFKYLLLNHANVDEYTFKFAVFGGNIEIIKISNQLLPEINNFYEVKQQTIAAIKKHENSLFDWIFEQKCTKECNNYFHEIAFESALNGNVHSFIEVVENRLSLIYTEVIKNSMENGFFRFSQLAVKIADSINNIELMYVSVLFDNISIFQLALQIDKNQDRTLESLYAAIKNESINITQYILDTMKFEIDENILKKLFSLASNNKSSIIFTFLLNKFNRFCSSLFNNIEWTESILVESCKYGTFDIAKFCIDMIVTNENSDFTKSFIVSCQFCRKEICKYLFDEKAHIKYEQLLTSIDDFYCIDVPTFSLIINNCPFYVKEKFMRLSIKSSITNHNLNILNFLLKEKVPPENSLFCAIKCKDLKAINIILENNSMPSFINQISIDGTALNLATKLNDLSIVKRLLSLQGINPDICDSKGMTPIMNVNIHNYEMIDLFLDFYCKNIVYKFRELNHLIQKIFEGFQIENQIENSNLFILLDRILEISNINVDYYYYQYNIFDNIFKTGNINFIHDLLDMKNFNINISSPTDRNTLLIDAIESNSFEIAEILINNPQMNINQKNIKNETALVSAVKLKQYKIIDLLINNVKFEPEESLLNYAFYLADYQTSKLLSNLKSLDVNFTIYNYTTNIYYVKPKQKEFLFETTLMSAVQNNDIEKVDLIIHHSSFDKNRSSYQAAIYISIKNNFYEIFKTLLHLLDNINYYDYNNHPILSLAAKYHNNEMIKEIFQFKNYNPKKADFLNSFIELFKLTNESYEMMNMMINYDKQHNHFIDFSQLLPNELSFFTSLKADNKSNMPNIEKIVDLFLENGADPNQKDINDVYPLERAIVRSKEFSLALLKSDKIDLSIKLKDIRKVNKNKPPMKTFLHLAAKEDSSIFIEILRKGVIDINSEDIDGNTPLMIACQYKNTEIVELLFKENNLDFLHCNKNGQDALKIVFGPDIQPVHDKNIYLQQLLSKLSHK